MAMIKEDYCGHSIYPDAVGPNGGPFTGSFAIARFDENRQSNTVHDARLPGTFDTEFAALDAAMKAAREYVIGLLAASH